eukprot:m.134307 g.134307  ORF g.134307 m.134307 type:complete len:80 (-) comp9547_c0_seq1:1325-1564(-)
MLDNGVDFGLFPFLWFSLPPCLFLFVLVLRSSLLPPPPSSSLSLLFFSLVSSLNWELLFSRFSLVCEKTRDDTLLFSTL